MRSIGAFYQANMECIKTSNMRYKSVIKLLGKKAESIVQVNVTTIMAPPTSNSNFIPS